MRIIEFIFKLLFQFIQFEPGRFSELKDKAFKWQADQDKIIQDDGAKQKWFHKLFKYDSEWWFQILLCFVFLWAFKAVKAWLLEDPIHGRDDDDDDDDDDDEDGEDDVRSNRRVALGSFKM